MFKNRTYYNFKQSLFQNASFNSFYNLSPFYINNKQLVKLVLYLKRSTKRSNKLQRFFWIFLFPNLPLTKKAKGLRMGKGKGKRILWFTIVRGGSLVFKLINIRKGRLIFFLKRFVMFLNINFKFFFKNYNQRLRISVNDYK